MNYSKIFKAAPGQSRSLPLPSPMPHNGAMCLLPLILWFLQYSLLLPWCAITIQCLSKHFFFLSRIIIYRFVVLINFLGATIIMLIWIWHSKNINPILFSAWLMEKYYMVLVFYIMSKFHKRTWAPELEDESIWKCSYSKPSTWSHLCLMSMGLHIFSANVL